MKTEEMVEVVAAVHDPARLRSGGGLMHPPGMLGRGNWLTIHEFFVRLGISGDALNHLKHMPSSQIRIAIRPSSSSLYWDPFFADSRHCHRVNLQLEHDFLCNDMNYLWQQNLVRVITLVGICLSKPLLRMGDLQQECPRCAQSLARRLIYNLVERLSLSNALRRRHDEGCNTNAC